MDGGQIAALIAAGAFLMLVLVLAVPILRLRHTVDAATRAINDLNERTGPLLGNVNTTVENVNTALEQVQTSLDGVNLQLAQLDTITEHAQNVTANVANLATVVTAAAANPLVKVAAFGYGVRKAAAGAACRRGRGEVRDHAQAAARGAARRGTADPGRRRDRRNETMKRLFWLGIGLAVGARGGPQADPEGAGVHPGGHRQRAVRIRWRSGRVAA